MPKESDDGEYDEVDTARRRDEVIKRMLSTPPKPKPKPPSESKRGRPKKA